MRNLILLGLGGLLIIIACFSVWLSLAELPDFKSFNDRLKVNSTTLYDRTGTHVLYDVHQNIKRSEVSYGDITVYLKNATVAIEDDQFYSHKGIRPLSIVRAVLANITKGSFSQGGSTITQQVIKNTLLTQRKTITRKIKEWVLAIKMEQVMSKDDILHIYLNEAPYGGTVYGAESASETYFGKHANSITLAESAYLAALPKAPSYYSPYGKNVQRLEDRKNAVLEKMHTLKFITDDEYRKARDEKVVFLPQQAGGIIAPHFVFYVLEELRKQYGDDMVDKEGLKVITSLDVDLQAKAEAAITAHAKENEMSFGATNAALVSTNPKTGEILAMVGSRNYFDKTIDGNFNVATAPRQPGSSFKPIVYAAGFMKGYTEDTVLFDVPTEFQTFCDAYGNPTGNHKKEECYNPSNFDNGFRGPMTIKNALAQSINIPAVKTLYLVGVQNAIKTARDMGIRTLDDTGTRYGLTLVIGGGEVTPLDMTTAYGVFANDGAYVPHMEILQVSDSAGVVLQKNTSSSGQIIFTPQVAREISDILTDNKARTPTYGANSALIIPGKTVAVKTGTTNNNKDAWTVGYTPSLVTGVWVGNNDNTPMKKGGVALAGPIWHDYMAGALAAVPDEGFPKPDPTDPTLKPVLRGLWQGGDGFTIDTISGKLATDMTPIETREDRVIPNVHDILFWVDKNNPTGPAPTNPGNDGQFSHWETAVQDWWSRNKGSYPFRAVGERPTGFDTVHTEANKPQITFIKPLPPIRISSTTPFTFSITTSGFYPFKKMDIYLNNTLVGSTAEKTFTFTAGDLGVIGDATLRIVAYDTVWNSNEITETITIQ
jgi:1A family penicillin-binding protein